MKIQSAQSVANVPVEMPGAVGCRVRWLVGQPDGAPNFAMRLFEVEPGGHTPKHSHPYEHEVYVLEGEGIVLEGDRERTFAAGDVIYVAPDDVHQFRNAAQSPLKFLCVVPHVPQDTPMTLAPECGER